MSTTTDFYVGRGSRAEWIGSLQWDCAPAGLIRVPPGRLALAATDESTYRAAVADLFVVWESENIGHAYPRRTGWPWRWHTSHHSTWIITFDPVTRRALSTVGGGVRWEPATPHASRTDAPIPPGHGPVPLPLMRDPDTGHPTRAALTLTPPTRRSP
ncbi:hypothetical protein V5P93_002347 [Actinokineospora auranticolor]|uniref:Uncharacterized protein n=1 Tax=Actinokineospora auranticolor TaxID=155976 RepID=A0A2S6GDQ7_9PSEU|nr:hypothetical protein [Actinokineospora auranticolor]PPK63378.1 hypothetical protein CLV40_12991 [Actinokineospora auranticolor]